MGHHSALLTSKRKTLELFQHDVTIGIAAEAPQPEQIRKYGPPPQIYSREINYWLWEAAIDLLKNRSDISLIYVHITDYPMHAWAPEEKESQAHLTQLDLLLGEARKVAPDAAFLITADHGMNYKKRSWDLTCVSVGVIQIISPFHSFRKKIFQGKMVMLSCVSLSNRSQLTAAKF